MKKSFYVDKGIACAVVDCQCGQIMKNIEAAIKLEDTLDVYSFRPETIMVLDCKDNLQELNDWLKEFRASLEIVKSIFEIKEEFYCIFTKFKEEIIDTDYIMLCKNRQAMQDDFSDTMDYRMMEDVIDLYIKIIKTMKYVFDYLDEYQE